MSEHVIEVEDGGILWGRSGWGNLRRVTVERDGRTGPVVEIDGFTRPEQRPNTEPPVVIRLPVAEARLLGAAILSVCGEVSEYEDALARSATEPREYCANCGADTTDEPVGPCRACSGRA